MVCGWGTVVQEAKAPWYDAQSAWDCEQQLKCGLPFALGILRGQPGAGGSHAPRGWAGGAGHPHLLALGPGSLCFLKESLCLVCKLQCRSQQSKISLAFQLGAVIKYLFAKKGQNRLHLLNTPANFLQITFSWGLLALCCLSISKGL